MGLKDQRNDFEDLCLTQLKAILPEGVTIQADRGFGDVKLFEFLESLATRVGAAVCVHAEGMKEAWHLAASDATASASQIVNLYAKRWTINIDQAWQLSRLPWRGRRRRAWAAGGARAAAWRGSPSTPRSCRSRRARAPRVSSRSRRCGRIGVPSGSRCREFG